MRGKICIFVAALAALLALQGCMRRDAVIFQGISDVEVSMEASPRVGVVLLVENTSGRNITVRAERSLAAKSALFWPRSVRRSVWETSGCFHTAWGSMAGRRF